MGVEVLNTKKNPIKLRCEDNMLYIGDMSQLVVDLKTQQNYIVYQEGKIPYHREVVLSNDLLAGKRKNVLDTAVKYYYTQACEVVKGKQAADAYKHIKVKSGLEK